MCSFLTNGPKINPKLKKCNLDLVETRSSIYVVFKDTSLQPNSTVVTSKYMQILQLGDGILFYVSLTNGECTTWPRKEGQIRKKFVLWASVHRVIKHTSCGDNQTLRLLIWLSLLPSATLCNVYATLKLFIDEEDEKYTAS